MSPPCAQPAQHQHQHRHPAPTTPAPCLHHACSKLTAPALAPGTLSPLHTASAQHRHRHPAPGTSTTRAATHSTSTSTGTPPAPSTAHTQHPAPAPAPGTLSPPHAPSTITGTLSPPCAASSQHQHQHRQPVSKARTGSSLCKNPIASLSGKSQPKNTCHVACTAPLCSGVCSCAPLHVPTANGAFFALNGCLHRQLKELSQRHKRLWVKPPYALNHIGIENRRFL